MKEAPGSSETSVLTRATRRNNPEDTILHRYHPVLNGEEEERYAQKENNWSLNLTVHLENIMKMLTLIDFVKQEHYSWCLHLRLAFTIIVMTRIMNAIKIS
jgi:hypothetical protein